GPGIARRLEELVDTGRIAELDELEQEVRPELIGLGRLIGIGPKRMLEIAQALDGRTADEFRAAAAEGQLRGVRRLGGPTEREPLARLSRPPEAQPRQALVLPQARELLSAIADSLGGEVAGDARRWVDAPETLAVVVPAGDPAPVLEAFER